MTTGTGRAREKALGHMREITARVGLLDLRELTDGELLELEDLIGSLEIGVHEEYMRRDDESTICSDEPQRTPPADGP